MHGWRWMMEDQWVCNERSLSSLRNLWRHVCWLDATYIALYTTVQVWHCKELHCDDVFNACQLQDNPQRLHDFFSLWNKFCPSSFSSPGLLRSPKASS